QRLDHGGGLLRLAGGAEGTGVEERGRRPRSSTLSKKADAFSDKGDSLRSAPRGLWPLRRSLHVKCFPTYTPPEKRYHFFRTVRGANSARLFQLITASTRRRPWCR